jgi:hypothetical protein
MAMRISTIGLLAVLFLASACATERQEIEIREDLLVKAGFVVKPANTPERL